jgi:hypothetical protein
MERRDNLPAIDGRVGDRQVRRRRPRVTDLQIDPLRQHRARLGEAAALEVGDEHEAPLRLVHQELGRLVEHRGVARRPRSRRDGRERGARVRGCAGRRHHVGAVVERDQRDPIALRLVDGVPGQGARAREAGRGRHAERPVDRHDRRPARRRGARDVGAGEGARQEEECRDAGRQQQQVAEPVRARAVHRAPAQEAHRRERHGRRHVASQQVQHDRQRYQRGAEQVERGEEAHRAVTDDDLCDFVKWPWAVLPMFYFRLDLASRYASSAKSSGFDVSSVRKSMPAPRSSFS